MPPPIAVTRPIRAAGTGSRPYSSALSAPVTQNRARPKASKTTTIRSTRPTTGWKAKVSSPAATGTRR